ncbi:MAG: hypothetical protein K0R62_2071 [Nonomuraea muscovyensis]|nr:hypothetical protein [Nonomuraea muscovyensis]
MLAAVRPALWKTRRPIPAPVDAAAEDPTPMDAAAEDPTSVDAVAEESRDRGLLRRGRPVSGRSGACR